MIDSVCKNALWIAKQHLKWAHQVTNGKLERLLGMVMDNTSANGFVIALFACFVRRA